MKKFLNIYGKFALLLHELSHALVGTLLLNKVDYMYVKTRKDELCGVVVFERKFKTLFGVIMVNLSPLFLMLFFVGMCFVSKFFLIIVIYQLSVFRLSLPSKGDILNIKNFGKVVERRTLKDDENDEEMDEIEKLLLETL